MLNNLHIAASLETYVAVWAWHARTLTSELPFTLVFFWRMYDLLQL